MDPEIPIGQSDLDRFSSKCHHMKDRVHENNYGSSKLPKKVSLSSRVTGFSL